MLRKTILHILATVLVAALSLSTPAMAQQELTVEAGAGRVITLPRSAASVFVADPKIADVQATQNGRSLFVNGRTPGRTSVVALAGDNSEIAAYSIVVGVPIEQLRQRLSRDLPDLAISVEQAQGGVVLSGQAPNPSRAQDAVEIAKAFAGERPVINRITLPGSTQVNLRVRVAEVSRSVSEELGFNWESLFRIGDFTLGLATGRDAINDLGTILRGPNSSATLPFQYQNDDVDMNVVVDALVQDGMITVLAEPNLTAVSGETASFLAGGEFPIPVALDDDRLTLEFKKYGISLDFTPTVLSSDRISLKVRPEVSELTEQGAIILEGFRIPGLSVRRAETTVELGSGQSFAIAGLLSNSSRTVLDKVPGLGEVPVLGALFRSSRFQRNESELVILVTPYLVRPVQDPAALSVANDLLQPASDVERLLLGRLNTPGVVVPDIGPGGRRLRGDVGFMLD